MNKKQRKDAEFKAKKEQAKKIEEEVEDQTPGAEDEDAQKDETKKEIIPGMTGQFATQAMGKRAKKRALDE